MFVDSLVKQFIGWTPYHYVHQNPINLIDPTGISKEGGEDYIDIRADALMTYFSHSHPGNFDFNTGNPAYPSGFDENINPTNIKGNRHTFKDLKYLYKSRIPEHFDIYVPYMPNIKLKFNGNEVKRTF